ncbi:MAG TPA: hypothetical protein VE549_10235 [Myxococcaceae bacterium]|nr:hypothetical protein [Myxococcaceae bacterium]
MVNQRAANAAGVGNPRAFADPDAAVHDPAQVLDEVSVQIGRHRANLFTQENLDMRVRGAAAAWRGDGGGSRQGDLEELATIHVFSLERYHGGPTGR